MVSGCLIGKACEPQLARGISNPSLTYSNALPRDDLQPRNDALVARIKTQNSTSHHRPRSSEGHHSRSYHKPLPQSLTAGSDSQRDTGVASNNIPGILPQSQRKSPQLQQSNASHFEPADQKPMPLQRQQKQQQQHRKPSMWGKIGGLFKSKKAVKPSQSQPAYQVRVNGRSLHDLTSSANFLHEPTPPKERSKRKENRGRKKEKSAQRQDCSIRPQMNGHNPATDAPMLQVEIPKIEMERYSVMFSGLLDKRNPSLMARRGKNLDTLTIAEEDESSTSTKYQRHQQQSASTTSRTPSFTLFPTTRVSKAARVLGTQNLPPCPSPALRVPNDRRQSSREDVQDLRMVRSPASSVPLKERDSQMSATSPEIMDSKPERHLPFQKPKPTKIHSGKREETNREVAIEETEEAENEVKELPSDVPRSKYAQNHKDSKAAKKETGQAKHDVNQRRVTKSMSPEKNHFTASQQVESTRLPFIETHPDEQQPKVPNVEVSVARSVSVSKAKKHVLIPVGKRTDSSKSNEHSHKGKTAEVVKSPEDNCVPHAGKIEST